MLLVKLLSRCISSKPSLRGMVASNYSPSLFCKPMPRLLPRSRMAFYGILGICKHTSSHHLLANHHSSVWLTSTVGSSCCPWDSGLPPPPSTRPPKNKEGGNVVNPGPSTTPHPAHARSQPGAARPTIFLQIGSKPR